MLELKNLFRTSLKSIYKNRMRSLLTSLGIIIGVSAVIVMVAIGEGASEKVKENIASLGTDMLMIRSGASRFGGANQGAGSARGFTIADFEKIRDEATTVKAMSAMARTSAQVIAQGNNWNTTIEGVNPEFQYIKDWKLQSGEFFTERDVKSSKKVALIGKTVADELFPDQDPIGEKIRIRNTPFMIIGVLKEKGQSPMGNDQDDIILAPVTTVLYRLKGGNYIDMIFASAYSYNQIAAAQNELTQIIRDVRGIKSGMPDDFEIRTQAEITEMASSTAEVLTMLLGSIAAVSLIVGGIGIMNIMLVSVTERTREIGIRLSIGARENDILIQFLTESVLLSSIGGGIGVILALGIGYILDTFTSLMTVENPAVMFLAFFFAAFVGIFFGFYPAKKAARLNPIEALRYE